MECMTHTIEEVLELRKDKFRVVSKINAIKNTPFTAVAKKWEESSNSNKEIIWQWRRIYSDTIQIYFYEREYNYWYCHNRGQIFHILLINTAVLVLRLHKPGQINRQSLKLQYVVIRAKDCRKERFLTAPLKMSNFYILPFALNLA